MTLKQTWKKIWYFIWEDDSIWSWIVNIILAIILIKFIVYPGLGFILGTSHPIVAVVSGSMEHDGSFDDWWQTQQDWYFNNAITKEQFQDSRFKNGFNRGDIMILYRAGNLKIGDTIVFQTSRPEPIIHRVVKINEDSYQTKGDHNFDSAMDERNIKSSQIIGKAVFRIPYLGYIKILFVELLCVFNNDMPICNIT